MRPILNIWQRALLLVSAGGIAWATAWHGFESGFEGLDWVLAFVIAAAMAFIALSSESKEAKKDRQKKTEPRKKVTPSASNVLDFFRTCHGRISDLMPRRKFSETEAAPFDPKLLGESDFAVRSAVYAYVIAVVAAQRIDSEYIGSSSFKEVTKVFNMVLENLWAYRLGKGTSKFPRNDGAKNEVMILRQKAEALLAITLMRIAKKDSFPFEPLYRHIEMKPDAAADTLQTKYEMTTCTLIDDAPLAFKQNTLGTSPLVTAPEC